MAQAKPIGKQPDGTPIFAFSSVDGVTPVCGAATKRKDSKHTYCHAVKLTSNGRCRLHGGSKVPKQEAIAIRTREQFKDRLADPEMQTILWDQLKALASKGAWDTVRWCWEMQIGSPKTTVETIVTDVKQSDAASAAVAELERDLEIPGLHERWLSLYLAKLDLPSPS